MNKETLRAELYMLAGVVGIGAFGFFFGGTITVETDWEAGFWPRFVSARQTHLPASP